MNTIATLIGYVVICCLSAVAVTLAIACVMDWIWRKVRNYPYFVDMMVIYMRHGRRKAIESLKKEAVASETKESK